MIADTFYGGSALPPPIQRPRRSAASGRVWERAAAEDAGIKGLKALTDTPLFWGRLDPELMATDGRQPWG